MLDYIITNKEWILSGIGVFLLNLIFMFFYNKKTVPNLKQSASPQSVQVGGNVSGNVNISVQETPKDKRSKKLTFRLIILGIPLLIFEVAIGALFLNYTVFREPSAEKPYITWDDPVDINQKIPEKSKETPKIPQKVKPETKQEEVNTYDSPQSLSNIKPDSSLQVTEKMEPEEYKQNINTRKDTITNSIGMQFVYISPGTFMMGSPKNEPGRDDNEKLHEVTLTKGFYLQTTEVTQKQWTDIMGNNPSRFKECGNDCPVEKISWNDVQDFIAKMNRIEKRELYRLPTEAEWEYSARAGTQKPFYFGDCLSTDEANYNGNYPLKDCNKGIYRRTTMPVASFQGNAWGLYDMHGNVWEWCQDWYGKYSSEGVTDPTGPSSGSNRVFRGGGWYDYAHYCRSANRNSREPGNRNNNVGFRLLRTAP